MKRLNLALALAFTIAATILCQQIIKNSLENQKNKIDYAELNSIKYGMFSVNEWKERLVAIVKEEFDRLYVSNATEKELREHIAVILNKIIDEVAVKIKKTNEKTATGKLKQVFIDMFVDIDDVKKGIPEYTDAVIQEMQKKKTKDQMRTLVDEQLTEYATKTADTQDRSLLLKIYDKTGTTNIAVARKKINDAMRSMHDLIVKQSLILVLLLILPFFMLIKNEGRPTPILFMTLIISLILLLVTGIATPMIDMEAKISELKFMLIGHAIQFDNQVLYFQSKSILDVFMVMITHGQLQMKFVGILLVMFSVFFPLLKLISTVGYYINFRGSERNKSIHFFVFKSGKWSMTDVMVVAIFMVYIGFNGIIENQLDTLSSKGGDAATVLTTNGTSLQPGFYLFLTYALLAIFLSQYLAKKAAKTDKPLKL